MNDNEEPERFLDGYIKLTGQLKGLIARQLPLIMAQRKTSSVQIVFREFRILDNTVLIYEWPDFQNVKRRLPPADAWEWARELNQVSAAWSANCFASWSEVQPPNRLDRLNAEMIFYQDGRLRLTVWPKPHRVWQHVKGEWRQPDPVRAKTRRKLHA